MDSIDYVKDFQIELSNRWHDLSAPLPSQIIGKVIVVAIRIFRLCIQVLKFPIAVIKNLICNRTSRAPYLPTLLKPDPDLILKKALIELKNSAAQGWQEKSVKLIKKARHSDAWNELRRLRTLDVLTHERETQLDKSLASVKKTKPNKNTLQTKVIMAQALELKEIYGETHDVFIHAQATKWMIFSNLVKEFTRTFSPKTDLHQFKFLRNYVENKPEDNKSFFSRMLFWGESQYDNVQDYLNSKWWINDSSEKMREELLSVDAFIYNYSNYESSMYFLANNENIVNNSEAIKKFSRKVIQHFCPQYKNEGQLHRYVNKIAASVFQQTECGNLFVICLPKAESHKISYRAHPFGHVCYCHPEREAKPILQSLQNGSLNDSSACKSAIFPKSPQYRLYTPLLGPGKDQRIFLLSPLSKNERKNIKAPIKEIANELCRTA